MSVSKFRLTPPTPFVPKEFDEQVALFTWRHWQQFRQPELRTLFATLNGVRVSIGLAKKLKAAGMTGGVPDIVLPIARGSYYGLFIELKRQKHGVLSDDQEKWLCWLKDEGYMVRVARGSREAIAIIEDYLKQPRTVCVPFLTHLPEESK